jgi:hypothetical protein
VVHEGFERAARRLKGGVGKPSIRYAQPRSPLGPVTVPRLMCVCSDTEGALMPVDKNTPQEVSTEGRGCAQGPGPRGAPSTSPSLIPSDQRGA